METKKPHPTPAEQPPAPQSTDTLKKQLEASLSRPFVGGNRIDILQNGREIFPAMLEAIESAQRQIEFLTYVYWTGEIAVRFAETLAAKAREGVEVRVLLDSIGAYQMDDALVDKMTKAGVDVRWFRPIRKKIWKNDNRTHRKILICDNRIGFTGGVGIADEWKGDARNPGEWRDDHFRIRGPAVQFLAGAFWSNWREVDRDLHVPPASECPDTAGELEVQVIASAASTNLSEAAILMRQLLASAQSRIRICTPYFVIDEMFKKILTDQAKAGVTIEIMIPGEHIDSRFDQLAGEDDFQELIELEIGIYRYQKSMMHSKIVMIDAHLSSIGSCNLNQRSLFKDDEVVVNIWSAEFQSRLSKHFERDLEFCDKVSNAEWRHRSLWQRTLETVPRPFKQQL